MSAVVVGVLALVLALVIGIMAYPALRIAPYVYAASRAKAARGRILKTESLHDLATQSYTEAIYVLEKQGHPELLEVLEDGFREDKVQRTLREKFHRELTKLSRSVPGRARGFLRTLNTIHDIQYILATLRSKSNEFHEHHKDTDLFMDTTYFEKDTMQGLPLEAVFERIRNTPFYPAIDVDEVKKGKIGTTEHNLYVQYYSSLKQKAPNDTCKQFVRHQIDIHNIKQALCFGEPKFIEGGTIQTKKLEVSNLEELKRVLKKTAFPVEGEEVPIVLRELERKHAEFGRRLGMCEPLGMGQVISYYIQKGVELRNIRILLKLLTVRFRPKDIQEVLI